MPELSPYILLSKKQKLKQWLKSFRARFAVTAKPEFFILGAQKAGTTALQATLCQHPQLARGQFKELHYFSNDAWYSRQTLHQYHSFFPAKTTNDRKYFEATPMYLYHPQVAERLWEYNPNSKLVVMLREPAMRAFSAWKMYHHQFPETKLSFLADPRSFSKAISEELAGDLNNFSPTVDHHAYVKRGLYDQQLARYFARFPRDRILVVNSELMRTEGELQLKRILNFLEVKEIPLSMRSANKGVQVEGDFEAELERLREFYKPHNQKLFKTLGVSWDWPI